MRFDVLPGACLLLMSTSVWAQEATGTSAAATEENAGSEHLGEAWEHHKNIASVRFAYSRHAVNADLSDDGLAHGDNLYGFVLAYERVLIPDWITLEVAKPFLWGEERFDSPFDISISKPFRFGHHLDLFVGAGMTINFRVFDEAYEHLEGQGNENSVGLLLTGGIAYLVNEHWGVTAVIDYAYIPGNFLITQEFSPSIGPMFSFM